MREKNGCGCGMIIIAFLLIWIWAIDQRLSLAEERIQTLEEQMDTMMNLTTDDGMICAYDCKEN